MIKAIKKWWHGLSEETRYILVLFVVTRIMLTIVGVISSQALGIHYVSENIFENRSGYPVQPWLNIWGQWDTEWYLKIAREGYPHMQQWEILRCTQFGFFPLFGWLVALFNTLIGNYFIAGLILSNVFLLLACKYLVLVLKIYKFDVKKGIKYLFLFPTAFILSGVNPESLLLLLTLGIIYYAHEERWLLVGLLGFLVTLTRLPGLVILLPVIWILYEKKYPWKQVLKNSLPLLMFFLAIPVMLWIGYDRVGDPFAYFTSQKVAWSHSFANPFSILYKSMFSQGHFIAYDNPAMSYVAEAICGWFAFVAIVLLLISYKKIPLKYTIYCLLLIIMVPANGYIYGILRYLCTMFPLYIILSLYAKKAEHDELLTIFLTILQGGFMALWVNGLWFIS